MLRTALLAKRRGINTRTGTMSKRFGRSTALQGRALSRAAGTASRRSFRSTRRVLISSGDLKGLDTPLNLAILADPTLNTCVQCVNLIQTGSGSWNRVGRKVFPRSLRVKAGFEYTYNNVGDQVQGVSIRWAVVWDKNPSGGALPTFQEMFKITDQTGTESTSWKAPPAFDSLGRFVVIRDQIISINPDNFPVPVIDGISIIKKEMDEYIPLPPLETVYSGQNNPLTIADVYSGALYWIVIADAGLPSGYGLQLSPYSSARLRYTD